MNYANNQFYRIIDNTITSQEKKLLDRIEYLAKTIILGNDCISGYCRAMGSASFQVDYSYSLDDDNETIETYEFLSDYNDFINLYNHLTDTTSYDNIGDLNCIDEIKELTFIMDNYDHIFHFSGNPLKIDKEFNELVIKTDW